jgi:hypothetical protein
MNFGKWIVVAFVLFTLFIATLVTVCVRQDIPLVTKNYYEEELEFQDQITRLQNTEALIDQPDIRITDNNVVVVTYSRLPEVEHGKLKLFRPSDAGLDQTFVIDATSSTSTRFTIDHPVRGLYKAQFAWKQSGKEYFIEKVVVL